MLQIMVLSYNRRLYHNNDWSHIGNIV